ncbi:MAG: 1,4-dihydroxy-2-naphthoate polyprenyltransferase [Bacilli bacterium]
MELKQQTYNPMTPRIFWHLIRPHTLTAAFIPVFIGSFFSHETKITLHWDVFLLFLLACLLIQAATNIFNEYYDWVRGLDTKDAVGIGGTIVREFVNPILVRNTGFVLYALSVFIGIYLCIVTSWWLALVGILSMAVGFFYTGGPKPIAYTPFGEWFAGFFMGTVIINIGYYLQTNTITFESIVVSLPIALLIAAILLANNIRDWDNDEEKGRRTLAILVGKQNARLVLIAFFAVAYASIVVFVLLGMLSVWALLVFLSIGMPFKAWQGFQNKSTPKEMMPAMAMTAKTNTVFGLLLCLSFVLSYLF